MGRILEMNEQQYLNSLEKEAENLEINLKRTNFIWCENQLIHQDVLQILSQATGSYDQYLDYLTFFYQWKEQQFNQIQLNLMKKQKNLNQNQNKQYTKNQRKSSLSLQTKLHDYETQNSDASEEDLIIAHQQELIQDKQQGLKFKYRNPQDKNYIKGLNTIISEDEIDTVEKRPNQQFFASSKILGKTESKNFNKSESKNNYGNNNKTSNLSVDLLDGIFEATPNKHINNMQMNTNLNSFQDLKPEDFMDSSSNSTVQKQIEQNNQELQKQNENVKILEENQYNLSGYQLEDDVESDDEAHIQMPGSKQCNFIITIQQQ
ncbi:hypothetical protein PPERSA_07670 [Pseudocohnilembus persalinus]|uniref:Uncharacterized protein n=1 Tax=Pseudocohnilembus persalinus TaxID=266149 RepID=A0A0V0QIH7_PSEPJ|nr:hypothetical protein PPERSA_07670 [Pseudocohnilembus persalinus]|eukprot:KRX02025.1 hypothetical protein PPERSA_07670 [Pseudocohnilembus persalinus]